MIAQYSGLQQYMFILTLMGLQVNGCLADLHWIVIFQAVSQLRVTPGCGLGSDLLHACLFWGPGRRATDSLGHAFLMVGYRMKTQTKPHKNIYYNA